MTTLALILDYGEVLTRAQPRDLLDRMASLAELPLDQFLSRYWRHRRAYDAGLSGVEYWQRILEGVPGLPATIITDLIEADYQSWSDYRPDVWEIAAAFRARGGRTAMLSNNVPDMMARMRARRPLEPWFDVVVASCEVGCCKPDPAIYRICVERLAVPAAETLFVDDRLENLDAAETIGLRTLHFIGDDSVALLRRTLSLIGTPDL